MCNLFTLPQGGGHAGRRSCLLKRTVLLITRSPALPEHQLLYTRDSELSPCVWSTRKERCQGIKRPRSFKRKVFKSSWALLNWEVAFLKVSTTLELKEKAVLRWSNLYVLLQRRPRTSFSTIAVEAEELTRPATRTQAVLPVR